MGCCIFAADEGKDLFFSFFFFLFFFFFLSIVSSILSLEDDSTET